VRLFIFSDRNLPATLPMLIFRRYSKVSIDRLQFSCRKKTTLNLEIVDIQNVNNLKMIA